MRSLRFRVLALVAGFGLAMAMLLAAIMFSWFGLQRRKWQHGEGND
jgi:multiple sugar transport system permease protein